MPVALTIKQVPDLVAEALRRRAAANHRSLQRELMLIVERAAVGDFSLSERIAEPPAQMYGTHRTTKPRLAAHAVAPRGQPIAKLDLEQLWQRARKLGASTPDESTAIIRRDRDARQRR